MRSFQSTALTDHGSEESQKSLREYNTCKGLLWPLPLVSHMDFKASVPNFAHGLVPQRRV